MKKINAFLFLLSLVCWSGQAFSFSLFDDVGLSIFGGSEEDDKVIWEKGPNQYFKLVDQDDKSFGPNDHPVELKAEVLATALGLLKVKGNDSDTFKDLVPVFDKAQVSLLSRHMAEALKQASPGKDIVFVFEQAEQKMMGLKKDSFFIAGRAFFKDDRLNIILGDFKRPRNRGYEAAYDPSNAGIVNYNFDHGGRTKASSGSNLFTKKIYELPGIETKKGAQARPDWFVIDLGIAAEAYAQREAEERQKEMQRKRNELEEILGQPISNMYQGGAAYSAPQKSTEDRLETLNELKEKGLITEEEYADKRKQIIDQL